jgi:2-polyprenyl-6-methoxyphenol hydroxylase-like FAD-dependent oxidoreductase
VFIHQGSRVFCALIIRSNWIVGCDGGRSAVRETLGLKMEGVTLPGEFWLLDGADLRRAHVTVATLP